MHLMKKCYNSNLYNLTEKWNIDIDFFQLLICYNISNFDLIKKCYKDNL